MNDGEARAWIVESLNSADESAPLILDFDETLWLRNSTESFLDCARPRALIAVLLRLIELLKPWKILPGDNKAFVYRDWIRVLAVLFLAPWSYFIWRRQCGRGASSFFNGALLDIINSENKRPIYIFSNGFSFVLRPLLAPLDRANIHLWASPLWRGFKWRQTGKRSLAEQRTGRETLGRTIFVTDSTDDQDLLDACRFGLCHRWQGSRFIPAMRDVYVPFDYLQNIKKPGQNFLFKVVLREELILLWLIFLWNADNILISAVSILMLHLAFWVIYEVAYTENDRVAMRFEHDPNLSPGYEQYLQTFDPRAAWVWFFLFSGLAIGALILFGAPPSWIDTPGLNAGSSLACIAGLLVLWTAYIIATRVVFYLFNHVDKTTRVSIFPLLQFAKYLGFCLFFSLSLPGAALILAQVLHRWIPYVTYRYGRTGPTWQTPDQLFRLIILVIAITTIWSSGPGFIETEIVQILVILLWCGWRARKDSLRMLDSTAWLPKQARQDAETQN
ncbi:MAG: hypothetical protein H6905_07835 [Hyphomicrobiales bacterium]|nr:hypothetical protein [Hyphomicrobiales bacterium]